MQYAVYPCYCFYQSIEYHYPVNYVFESPDPDFNNEEVIPVQVRPQYVPYPIYIPLQTPPPYETTKPEKELLPDLFSILPSPSAYMELNPEGLPNYYYTPMYPQLLDPSYYVPVPVPQIRP